MYKLLKEIVSEFKKMPLAQQVEELRSMDSHDIAIALQDFGERDVRTMEYVRRVFSVEWTVDKVHMQTVSFDFEPCEPETSNSYNAANDERFALAA